MRVILDENLPLPLKAALTGHAVSTVQEEGLAGTENGALIASLEGRFDVFITADKNLRYQQNLSQRSLAIIEVPTNRLPLLRPLFPEIASAVAQIVPASYVRLTP